MTKDEALKMALETLEIWKGYMPHLWDKTDEQTIVAIKEALAQPQQEPVVWMYQNKSTHEVRFQKHMRSFVDHSAWYEVPLYSEPLANQEKTSGSPKPAKPEALRLADAMEYDLDWCDEAAAELRRMHDLLGKANALCRIRAEEIERLKAQPEQKPVAWKLVPVEPTKEMLKAMDECSKEGYDERLYAGHAASVYMAAVDVAPTPPQPWEKFCDSNCVWTDHHPDCKLAKRTWVHLTNEEHTELAIECGCLGADWVFYGAVVERKVREKNT